MILFNCHKKCIKLHKASVTIFKYRFFFEKTKIEEYTMKIYLKKLAHIFFFLWAANLFSQDFSGPEITSLTLSPTNVDLSTGSVTVTASIQVSDTTGVDLSRLDYPFLTGGSPGIVSGYSSFTNWSLISGNKLYLLVKKKTPPFVVGF